MRKPQPQWIAAVHSRNGGDEEVIQAVGLEPVEEKRQRAAALQDASRHPKAGEIPTGLGVRLPSAGFDRPRS
jgi:hypothetical protein